MVVFDVSDRDSFAFVTDRCVPDIRAHVGEGGAAAAVPILLVGNKTDRQPREVSSVEAEAAGAAIAQALHLPHHVPYTESSAKGEGHDVAQAFATLATLARQASTGAALPAAPAKAVEPAESHGGNPGGTSQQHALSSMQQEILKLTVDSQASMGTVDPLCAMVGQACQSAAHLLHVAQLLGQRLQVASATVLLKTLRVMLVVGTRVPESLPQLYTLSEQVVAATEYRTEPHPRFGDKPQTMVRNTARKCLAMIDGVECLVIRISADNDEPIDKSHLHELCTIALMKSDDDLMKLCQILVKRLAVQSASVKLKALRIIAVLAKSVQPLRVLLSAHALQRVNANLEFVDDVDPDAARGNKRQFLVRNAARKCVGILTGSEPPMPQDAQAALPPANLEAMDNARASAEAAEQAEEQQISAERTTVEKAETEAARVAAEEEAARAAAELKVKEEAEAEAARVAAEEEAARAAAELKAKEEAEAEAAHVAAEEEAARAAAELKVKEEAEAEAARVAAEEKAARAAAELRVKEEAEARAEKETARMCPEKAVTLVAADVDADNQIEVGMQEETTSTMTQGLSEESQVKAEPGLRGRTAIAEIEYAMDAAHVRLTAVAPGDTRGDAMSRQSVAEEDLVHHEDRQSTLTPKGDTQSALEHQDKHRSALAARARKRKSERERQAEAALQNALQPALARRPRAPKRSPAVAATADQRVSAGARARSGRDPGVGGRVAARQPSTAPRASGGGGRGGQRGRLILEAAHAGRRAGPVHQAATGARKPGTRTAEQQLQASARLSKARAPAPRPSDGGSGGGSRVEGSGAPRKSGRVGDRGRRRQARGGGAAPGPSGGGGGGGGWSGRRHGCFRHGERPSPPCSHDCGCCAFPL
eukprot:COSAG01_NODE_28_length_36622_cov_14.695751_13_plen_880_part_00